MFWEIGFFDNICFLVLRVFVIILGWERMGSVIMIVLIFFLERSLFKLLYLVLLYLVIFWFVRDFYVLVVLVDDDFE